MVSEKAAGVYMQKGYEWLLQCVRACAAVALGRAWRVETVTNEEKKCFTRRERRVMWCSVNVCGDVMKMG